MFDFKSLDDTAFSMSLRDTDHIDLLIGVEDLVHFDLLFEQGFGVVDLLFSGPAIDLDLKHVVLLLAKT